LGAPDAGSVGQYGTSVSSPRRPASSARRATSSTAQGPAPRSHQSTAGQFGAVRTDERDPAPLLDASDRCWTGDGRRFYRPPPALVTPEDRGGRVTACCAPLSTAWESTEDRWLTRPGPVKAVERPTRL